MDRDKMHRSQARWARGRFAADDDAEAGLGRGEFGPGGPPRGRGRRFPAGGGPGPREGRMRRGDIRTAVLAVLAEGPGHGYEVMQRLEAKSEGAWRPSPGSVYPTLQLLEDEGLVRSTEQDGKRVYEITDAGRSEAQSRMDEAGGAPWETRRGGEGHRALRDELGPLALAMKQVAISGRPDQVDKAAQILKDARKALYALLAED
jgi:DNA-binding PadR family transcriptional regulator